MHTILNKKIKIILVVIIWVYTLSVATATGADIPKNDKIKSRDAELVEFSAYVMETNIADSVLVIAEKYWVVGEFTVDGKKNKTVLTGADGHAVKLNHFKAGQKVYVRGYEVQNEIVYALNVRSLIQQKKVDKDYRTIEPLKPIDIDAR